MHDKFLEVQSDGPMMVLNISRAPETYFPSALQKADTNVLCHKQYMGVPASRTLSNPG